MKSRFWLLAVLLLLGVCVWIGRAGLRGFANSSLGAFGVSGPSAEKHNVRSIKFKDPRLKKLSTIEFSEQEIEAYLRRRGRTPSALILAYGLKFDPKLLFELESHADKPEALNALALDSSDPSIRLHWALELERKLGLENGYGSLVVAKAMAESGRKDEAVLYLKRSLEAPKFEGFGHLMMDEVEQLSQLSKSEKSIYLVTSNKAIPTRNWMVNVFMDRLINIPSGEGGVFDRADKNEMIGGLILRFAQNPDFEGFSDGPTTTQVAYEQYQRWLEQTKESPKYSVAIEAALDAARKASTLELKYHEASPAEVDAYVSSKLYPGKK